MRKADHCMLATAIQGSGVLPLVLLACLPIQLTGHACTLVALQETMLVLRRLVAPWGTSCKPAWAACS